MRPVRLTVIAVLFLLLSSCQWSENRYLERRLEPRDLVGSWSLRPQSVQALREAQINFDSEPSKELIHLFADGTCHFETFDPALIEGDSLKEYSTSQCTWKIQEGRHQSLVIELTPFEEKQLDYYFDETEDRELILWHFIGDPDAWRYVEYKKK